MSRDPDNDRTLGNPSLAQVTSDPITEAFNAALVKAAAYRAPEGPLAARHAAAREISRMASNRVRVDSLVRALRLERRRLGRLMFDTSNDSGGAYGYLGETDSYLATALDYALKAQAALDV
jgi:hypothetical protein